MSKKIRERHTDTQGGRQQGADRSSSTGNQQGTAQTGGQNGGGRAMRNQDDHKGNANESNSKRSSNK